MWRSSQLVERDDLEETYMSHVRVFYCGVSELPQVALFCYLTPLCSMNHQTVNLKFRSDVSFCFFVFSSLLALNLEEAE